MRVWVRLLGDSFSIAGFKYECSESTFRLETWAGFFSPTKVTADLMIYMKRIVLGNILKKIYGKNNN